MIASADLQQLLARVALGDRVAFRQLYDATAPSLFAVALRIVRHRDRAEEVLQDAFVNAWNRAAGYQAALSQPMTWLTAIVRDRALDELRSGARHRAESLDDPERGAAPEIEDERADPLGLLEQAADALAIRDCLDAIPWLLLAAKPAGAEGSFSKVTSVQRVSTVGGVAPKGGCSQAAAGTLARINYTAEYRFFTRG